MKLRHITLTGLILTLLTAGLYALPVGEIVVIEEIPWLLKATEDGSVIVGGAEYNAGGYYWTDATGPVNISNTSEASDISETGIIGGTEENPEGYSEACWWDIDELEPHFLGVVEGSAPMGDELNTVNAISADATTIVGLHWYLEGLGTAKAYKWTAETGCVLLPEVFDWYDSRADCCTEDGSLIGGYVGDPETSIWRPALWTESELIQLPCVNEGSSVVRGISPNGEWCSGTNGAQGAIWHNEELFALEGPNQGMRQTQFRHITDDGWACGEYTNFNSYTQQPLIWNPEEGQLDALEYFASLGAELPDGYQLDRVVWMSNNHKVFVGGGFDWNIMNYRGFILKLPAAYPVYDLEATVTEYNDIQLEWLMDDEIPGVSGFTLYRNGTEIAQFDATDAEYLDVDLDAGAYAYEIVVNYTEFGDSWPLEASVEVLLPCPTDLAAEVTVFDVELNWTPPAEQRSLVGYNIYRDGVEIGFASATEYLDTVEAPESYEYHLTALYSGDYESAPGDMLVVEVAVASYIPLEFSGEVDGNNDVQLTWGAPVENPALTGYRVYRDDEPVATVSGTAYTDSGLADGVYSYFVTTLFNDEYESDPTETVTLEVEDSQGVNSVQPEEFTLEVYPNPFNPQTTIEYNLVAPAAVKITVFDMQGRQVCQLLNQAETTGVHQIAWQGRDDRGNMLTSGVYFIHLQTYEQRLVKRVTLLK